MTEEFKTLSEKIKEIKSNCGMNTYSFSVAEKIEKEVRESLRELKEEINADDDFDILALIDKLAGDDLI